MNKNRNILILILLTVTLINIQAQSHLSVDVDEDVYRLLDIAEMRGILYNLSQVRPYSKAQIVEYLNEILSKRNRLSEQEQTVLDSAIYKYRDPDRERSFYNIATEGKVHYNNEEDAMFPIDAGLSFNFETRGDFNSGAVHSTNFFTFFIEGDMGKHISYNIDFSLGLNTVNRDAFSPFAYTDIATDSFYLDISSGLEGAGHVDGDKDGGTFSMMSRPEISSSFFDGALQMDFARVRRDIGNGYGNLSVSGTARPYTGVDMSFRPLDWFGVYYTVGAMNNWFRGKDWGGSSYTFDPLTDNPTAADYLARYNSEIEQKMLSLQQVEFMPFKWLYASLSTSVMWGKRLEFAYLNPFLPPMFAQLLTGDHDNSSVEMQVAVKIPFGLKIYGGMYFDEMRGTRGMLIDPVMPYATQAGIKYVMPGLPFTLLSFQYTKLEPYVYAHYGQVYYFADDGDLYDLSWTNNGENLGYHLPPNSDEFMIRLESLPYRNLRLLLQYQYIRHGNGDPTAGGMPGYIYYGSYFQALVADKNFLHDGIYEKIHIATLEASYEFENLPIWFSVDYSWNHATNYETTLGNTMTKNILGMKIKLFP